MKVLLCGASGFLGRKIRAALEEAGHTVVGAGSAVNEDNQLAVDYAKDISLAPWLDRLQGVDAVINAVGVLRDSKYRPIEAVHSLTPMALFEACRVIGKQRGRPMRVIQISALGIAGNPTEYARTKREADEHLLSLHASGLVNATVLRPSIVFGKGGQSSKLFVALSKLPVLLLPRPVLTARVQPLAVKDLAEGVARLVDQEGAPALLECVGTEVMTLADFIANLRRQQGLRPALVLPLPNFLTRLSVSIGDLIPVMPWCSETLALLAKDNISGCTRFASILEHKLVPARQFWRRSWIT